MKAITYKAVAIANSEVPNHVCDSMFIKGEVYKVEVLPRVLAEVDKLIRQWKSNCGALWVMCEHAEPEMREMFLKEENEKEEFCLVEGKFGNSSGGSCYKNQGVLKTECRKYLQYIK